MKPVISVCASAIRTKWWQRYLDSLRKTQISYEVIFSGHVKPDFDLSLYPEFKYIYSTVKPCQAYQLCFWEASGEVIHWSSDDCTYSEDVSGCNNGLDIAYAKYKSIEALHGNDGKTVIAMNPCEDGGYPQAHFHRFFGGCLWSPVMAPLGMVPRHYLCDQGQGYSKSCISGQAENDVVMRILADGGRVEMALDAKLYIHHRQCHVRDLTTGKEKNDFRKWYPEDRRAIENAWVVEGYGKYEGSTPEKLRELVHISPQRLIPLDYYEKTEDRFFVSQGNPGQW